MHGHVLVKQGAQFFQVGGVDAAEIGVLQLPDGLDVHQALDILAQLLDPAAAGLQGQAIGNTKVLFVQYLTFAHAYTPLASGLSG